MASTASSATQQPQPVTVLMDDPRITYTAYGQAMSFDEVVANKTVQCSKTANCGGWIILYDQTGDAAPTIDLVFTGTSVTVNVVLWYIKGGISSLWLDGTSSNQINSNSLHPEDGPFDVSHACTISSLTLGDLEDQEHRLSIR
ncbi:hypothetical protein FRB94_012941 [Tulasnella sp. JGI-2019a]|nr:hypothetical protein FRB94_012941 [Tulasnella sp. JGI-2019a]